MISEEKHAKKSKPVVYGFSNFEEFLSSFTKHTNDPEVLYLVDAVFHLLLPRETGDEKRFKGGLVF